MEPEQDIYDSEFSANEQAKLQHKRKDKKIRTIAIMRIVSGWLFIASVLSFFAVNHAMLTPAAIDNLATYVKAGLSLQDNELSTVEYVSGTLSSASIIDNALVIADADKVSVVKGGGITQQSISHKYSNPKVIANDNYILLYDQGGYGITVATAYTTLYSITLQSQILTATISENGKATVVTDEQSYRSAVTVYNKEGQQEYKWSSSEYYVQSATTNAVGTKIATLAFKLNGSQLESEILFFEIGKEELSYKVSLGSVVGLQLSFLDDNVLYVATDTKTIMISQDYEIINEFSYAVDDLFAISYNEDKVAIATRSYENLARSEITILSTNGKQSEPIYISEELQSIDLTDNALAVLTTSEIRLYNSKLELLWANIGGSGGQITLATNDGSAYVLYAKQARIFTQGQ